MSMKRKMDSPEGSDDGESEEEMSQLERLRLQNIKERNALMLKLGLITQEQLEPPKKTPRPKKPKVEVPESERRKSVRIKERGSSRPMFKSFYEDTENLKSEESDERVLGTHSFRELCDEDAKSDILCGLDSSLESTAVIKISSPKEKAFSKLLSGWSISDGHCFKLCSHRIKSLHFHPSISKKIAIGGSVSGSIGIADIDQGETGVIELSAHSGPVSCLSTMIEDPTKIMSTSHDGTFSQLDIKSQVVTNFYMTERKESKNHLTWHEEFSSDVYHLGRGDGTVRIVDFRLRTKESGIIRCFERSVRTIHRHPLNDNYILVSSGTGACAIFDVRNRIEVSGLDHQKGLTGAFFSPCGDKILTTCNDHYIRVFDCPTPDTLSPREKFKTDINISHFMMSGAFMSPFRAAWFPGNNEAFHIASSLKPRRICVYSSKGNLIQNLQDEKLETICSLIDVHPTLPMIIGGNNKGKLHCFTRK